MGLKSFWDPFLRPRRGVYAVDGRGKPVHWPIKNRNHGLRSKLLLVSRAYHACCSLKASTQTAEFIANHRLGHRWTSSSGSCSMGCLLKNVFFWPSRATRWARPCFVTLTFAFEPRNKRFNGLSLGFLAVFSNKLFPFLNHAKFLSKVLTLWFVQRS